MFADRQSLEDDTENPYWIINRNKLNDETERLTGNLNASFKIFDWWDVSGRLGLDRYQTAATTYTAPEGAVRQKYQNGYLAKSIRNYKYFSTNWMSNMHKVVSDFDLNLLLGATTEYTKVGSTAHWGYDFTVPGTVSFNNIPTETQFFKDANSQLEKHVVFDPHRS